MFTRTATKTDTHWEMGRGGGELSEPAGRNVERLRWLGNEGSLTDR